MKKIGLVGFGYVGRAMNILFGDSITAIWDSAFPPRGSIENHNKPNDKTEVNKCDLAIIAVPTPSDRDGSCNTSIVEETVAWLETPLILIKSTVEPGTTDRLKKKYGKRICMSPEFISESRYWTPQEWTVENWPHLIIGGNPKDTQDIVDIFMSVLGPMKSYWQTDAKTAEMVKYIANLWGATKITWVNEMRLACEKSGVDWNEARELWLLDPRVNKCHTAVFKENRGFGNRCFPKDLRAFLAYSQKIGHNPELLETVEKQNKYFRQLNEKKGNDE